MQLKQDSKLVTREEIIERIHSIARQRERLCETHDRYNTSGEFNARQSKIAKLTAREDALRLRLRASRA